MPSHLQLPIVVSDAGPLAALTQDSTEEVAQSVALLLATPVGDRRAAPGYGLPDPLGRGLDPATVADAIETWEPRADPSTAIVDSTDADGAQHASVYVA